MLDIKIYGTHKRDHFIEEYKKCLPITDDDVIYDDRPNGGNAYYTCKKAWLQPVSEGVTHRLCLPDDMQLSKGFLKILNEMIEAHPDKVLCLFPFDRMHVWKFAQRQNTPYFNVHIMSGCGVVFPVQYIKTCFEWIDNHYENQDDIIDDIAMQEYFNANNVPYITTLPAIVQHMGDDSLITPNAPIRKTDVFLDDMGDIEVDWSCKKVGWLASRYYNEDKVLFGAKHNFKRRYNVKYRL